MEEQENIQIPDKCIVCDAKIEDQGSPTCSECEKPCELQPINKNELGGNMLSMNVKSKCCDADVEFGEIKSTCSDKCHEALMDKIVAENGETIEETDMHGNIRLIPTRFVLESGGLTERQIMTFPIKGQDSNKCACAVCKEGVEAVLKKQQAHLEKFGFYMHIVPRKEDVEVLTPDGIMLVTQFDVHTHGLVENFQHPDLQVFAPGLDPQVAANIIKGMVDDIKEGKKYEDGNEYDTVLKGGLNIKIAAAMDGDRPVLRVLLPNHTGLLQGDFYDHQVEDINNKNHTA